MDEFHDILFEAIDEKVESKVTLFFLSDELGHDLLVSTTDLVQVAKLFYLEKASRTSPFGPGLISSFQLVGDTFSHHFILLLSSRYL